jgi:hypothetical protein
MGVGGVLAMEPPSGGRCIDPRRGDDMAKFKLEPGEQVLMEGSLPYLKSRIKYIDGPAYLTDRRFVHANNLQARALGGLVGGLMGARIDLEIPLEAIAGISRSTFGRKNNPVIVLTTTDGKEHKLVAPFDEWFAAFDQALTSHRATRLVETHPGAWTAQRTP